MKALFSKLAGTPIRWQIAALLISTQIAAHIITIPTIVGLMGLEGQDRAGFAADSVSPMTTLLGVISASDDAVRRDLINAALASNQAFQISSEPPRALASPASSLEDAFQQTLQRRVPEEWRHKVIAYLHQAPNRYVWSDKAVGAAALIGYSQWLLYQPVAKSFWQFMPTVLLSLTILVLALPLTFLAIWSGSVLVAPIRALAEGADNFSSSLTASPIPVRGAMEIRKATTALNAMQLRLRKLVDERTHALAAIGHDMRTPLTRLRLKAEAIESEEMREALLEELSGLDRMIDSALSFLRSQHQKIALAPVNVSILARTIADEFEDQGKSVRYDGPDRLVAACDFDLLRRALENLVNNAITYAGSAVLKTSTADTGDLVIQVSDAGPGISQSEILSALEPFTKLSKERPNLIAGKQGGFGLGLAITNNIVTAHGGTLELGPNHPTGLIATIRIPATGQSQASKGKIN
jgi:signal transduction histidine kinase